jgi:acyl-CoA reductase-like NAD-dependent aldehyde dehydrogenase
VDRLIHYAGWADKYEQVLGNVNPVSGPYFNFTVTEPMGIIGLIAPDEAPLLALVSLFAPAIVSGNAVVALASESQPYPSILLGEMLATSDLPGGVVNLLTGYRKELLSTFATHQHLRGIGGTASADERKLLQSGAAESIKRVKLSPAEGTTLTGWPTRLKASTPSATGSNSRQPGIRSDPESEPLPMSGREIRHSGINILPRRYKPD